MISEADFPIYHCLLDKKKYYQQIILAVIL